MSRYLLRLFKNNDQGVALIELAIIIPVLLLLIIGIVEFGWIFNGYIALTGAAREGARVAAIDGDYDAAVYRHTSFLTGLNVVSVSKSGGASPGDDITVKVEGNIPPLVGLLPIPNPMKLSAEATMRREYFDD